MIDMHILSLLILMCSSTCANEPLERLRAVADRMTPATELKCTLIAGPNPAGRILKLWVKPDGSFYERQYLPSPAGSPNSGGLSDRKRDGKLLHYVQYAEDTLVASVVGAPQEFTRSPAEHMLDSPPGPVQWLYCPWPVLHHISTWLLSAPDLELRDTDTALHARSVSRSLELVIDAGGRVQRVTRGDLARGDTISATFMYATQEPAERPHSLRFTISAFAPTNRTQRDFTWRIDECQSGSSTTAFDPAVLDVSQYDPVTGNVVHPVKGLLYNRNQAEQLALAATWQHQYRPWIWGFTSVGVGGLLIYGYKRIRHST